MAGAPYHLDVTTEGWDAVNRALRAEEDGKQLRKELAKNLREALKPAAAEAKTGIMSMSAAMTTSPALRPAIAKKIRPEVKLGGYWTGARIKAFKTRGLRDFPNAPKRTQRAGGWRTRTFGRDEWRTQHGKTKWFDRAMHPQSAAYKAAVAAALEAMAARIAARSR